jgi:hypothetical protein
MRKINLLILFNLFYELMICQVDSNATLSSGYDNYYSHGHNKINDSLHQTVSKFGLYASAGIGIRGGETAIDATQHYSLSLARNCFLFSISESLINSLGISGSSKEEILEMNNTCFLAGISKRRKYSLASISTGLAVTNYYFQEGIDYSSPHPPLTINYKNKLSVPVEIKLLLLARNGIGIGLVIAKNFGVNLFAPACFNFSIVSGKWNRRRHF